MNNMLKVIRQILQKFIDDIDSGNCNMSEEDVMLIMDQIAAMNNKNDDISKCHACKYLNISRATFDRLIVDGTLPRGIHKLGFKELFWHKKDLDKYKTMLKAKR